MSDEETRGNNWDPRLDSRNHGNVSKRDLDLLEGLRYAKRIHFDHFTVPKMPWHTDDHKFGESSDDKPDKRTDGKVVGKPGAGDGRGDDKEGE